MKWKKIDYSEEDFDDLSHRTVGYEWQLPIQSLDLSVVVHQVPRGKTGWSPEKVGKWAWFVYPRGIGKLFDYDSVFETEAEAKDVSVKSVKTNLKNLWEALDNVG